MASSSFIGEISLHALMSKERFCSDVSSLISLLSPTPASLDLFFDPIGRPILRFLLPVEVWRRDPHGDKGCENEREVEGEVYVGENSYACEHLAIPYELIRPPL